jgi:hypothetical protein
LREEAADAEAARGVGLQDIDRPCSEQAAEVGGLVAVLAGCDLERDRRSVAQ